MEGLTDHQWCAIAMFYGRFVYQVFRFMSWNAWEVVAVKSYYYAVLNRLITVINYL